MVFSGGFDGLSDGVFLDAVAGLGRSERKIELDQLVAAQEWAARNSPESLRASGDGTKGKQSYRLFGGRGTPKVATFAGAVFGSRLGRSTHFGDAMISDALDLTHRLPQLWWRVRNGEVLASYARFVARKTRELDLVEAGYVDSRVAESADGRIPWSRFEALVEAAIKAADPEAARAKEEKARAHQFAKQTRTVTEGLGCFLIRADVATISLLEATVAYIAQALKDMGVEGDLDRRRVLAIAVLANPAQATELLAAYQAWKQQGSPQPDQPKPADPDQPELGDPDESADPREPWELDPDEEPDPTNAELVRRAIAELVALTGWRPDGRPPSVQWRELLPRVQLWVHIYAGETNGTGQIVKFDETGLVRIEGHGTTVTEAWVREVLGPLAKFTIRPVFHPLSQAPVDAWEVPDRHRKAVDLLTPADVFPFASASVNRPGGWKGAQIDHTDRFAWDEDGQPAGPGQSRVGNYSPLTQFHHNLKTHGGWDVKQPYPGLLIWRDPYGAYTLVDNTGSRQLRNGQGTTGDPASHQATSIEQTNIILDLSAYRPSSAA